MPNAFVVAEAVKEDDLEKARPDFQQVAGKEYCRQKEGNIPGVPGIEILCNDGKLDQVNFER